MGMEVEIKGLQRITVHYANSPGHRNIAEEHFEGTDPEFAEELQNQETLYLSLLTDVHIDQAGAPRDISHSGESSNPGISVMATRVIADEALARQLQEMENLSIHTHDGSHDAFENATAPNLPLEVGESSSNTNNNEGEAARQDDIDPDNMSYEQLQTLGEHLGHEGKGLSDELISYLESSRHKSGFFAKKGNHEECVICQSNYKNREELITLPCRHCFHRACITQWLKIQRTCPVCKYEVFG